MFLILRIEIVGLLSCTLSATAAVWLFFNDTATTEIYTRSLVGSVRCV